MSRTIKFRFWDSFDEAIHYCDFFKWKDYLSKFFIEHDSALQGENNPILMQFTGLKDKNGKDIYESDIVRVEAWIDAQKDTSGIYMVEYCIPDCAFCLVQLDKLSAITFNEMDHYEVIGNVFENPELIENK